MTEDEWLNCTDPTRMLEYLGPMVIVSNSWGGDPAMLPQDRLDRQERGDYGHAVNVIGTIPAKTSERKIRLFCVALCRAMWERFKHRESREAIEASERFADGKIHVGDLSAYHWRAHISNLPPATDIGTSRNLALRVSWGEAFTSRNNHFPAERRLNHLCFSEDCGIDKRTQCDMLREIVHYPESTINWDDSWRTPTIMSLATAAYDSATSSNCWVCNGVGEAFYTDERDGGVFAFGADNIKELHFLEATNSEQLGVVRKTCHMCFGGRRNTNGHLDGWSLAVLADAMEDVGCCESAILEHLRGHGPHVKGCWALDKVLGRD